MAARAATPLFRMSFPPRKLLLAHHGTAGGRRAESLALHLAVPGETQVIHLYVVPDFWAGMQGDDWLNNSWTRDAFGRHVENELERDARQQMAEVAEACNARGVSYESVLRFGDAAECVIALAQEREADLVVIGPPRPRGVQGLRSRMSVEKLVRGLGVPLVVASGQ
ncbi:MAG: universal stress protein [Betaproteobacteria bacterium]|nr:universal stress protein [Betaproteobacteria bacterium]